jgi:hypothetical protein
MFSSRRAAAATALFSVVVFGSGLALAGAVALGRINDEFLLSDDDEPDLAFVAIRIEDQDFAVEGLVEGSGTDGDLVRIGFLTVTPTNVNADDKQGRVRQSRFSAITFQIESAVPERDLTLALLPEKCAVDGKVNVPKDVGHVTVKCSGTNIYSDISASQEASIQAAFAGTKKVKVKISNDGAKGSVTIKLKGTIEGDS